MKKCNKLIINNNNNNNINNNTKIDNINYRLIMTVDTWERDSYGLFDYESNRVNKQLIRLQ